MLPQVYRPPLIFPISPQTNISLKIHVFSLQEQLYKPSHDPLLQDDPRSAKTIYEEFKRENKTGISFELEGSSSDEEEGKGKKKKKKKRRRNKVMIE